jgi:type IV fimbrial biogenesis protein FimT
MLIRVSAPSRAGFSVRGNRPLKDYVSYTPLGQTRMVNGALQMGTFTVCRPGRTAVEVVLANGGRVRVVRTGATCP